MFAHCVSRNYIHANQFRATAFMQTAFTQSHSRSHAHASMARHSMGFLKEQLGNYQFAAVSLFQNHGFVKRFDGALNLIVGGLLGGNTLGPQTGLGHQGKQ